MTRHASTDELLDIWLINLGRKVIAARQSRKLTPNALATKAGVSRQQLRRMESGENSSLKIFGRVLLALGLDWNAFLSDTPISDSMPSIPSDSEPDEVETALDEAFRQLKRARRLRQTKP